MVSFTIDDTYLCQLLLLKIKPKPLRYPLSWITALLFMEQLMWPSKRFLPIVLDSLRQNRLSVTRGLMAGEGNRGCVTTGFQNKISEIM